MGFDLGHTISSVSKLALRTKRKNEKIEYEKKKKEVNEIIESVLNQFKDKEGFLATLDKAGRDIIVYMISHEDEEKTLKVLEIIEDVNKEDKLGNSYLTIACLEHKVKVIEKLLDMGANPNHKTNPLIKALGRKNKENSAILELFIKYGVDLRMDIQGNTLEETIRSFDDDNFNVEGGAYGIKITQQVIFKDNLWKFKCAVCPECGYTETYIEDTTKIKKLVLDKKEK